jgi:serine protease inhibitor
MQLARLLQIEKAMMLLNPIKTTSHTLKVEFLFVAVAATLIMATACRKSASPLPDSPAMTSIVSGNTEFALDLYQKLKDQPGNLFFSPYSISLSSAMTYAGARGRTESEMAKTLHFSLPQEDLHTAFSELAARLEKARKGNRVTFTTANSLWGQKGYQFNNNFLDLAHGRYQADVQPVDFANSAESARSEINSWAEQKTKGKIKDLTGTGELTSETLLVLCNATYFKGIWQTQFGPKRTESLPFFTNRDNAVDVPMMYANAKSKTLRAENFKAIALPYAGGNFSMVVFLPSSNDGLPEFERQLNSDNLHKWIAELDGFQEHKVLVRLPRVRITQEFQLSTVLSTLGMPSAFSLDADLTGMSSVKPLFLAAVVHKAFVEINEEGTEAAAATAHVATRSQGETFIADHPFIFLIRENGSGSILFLGRIVDPTKE